MDEEEICHAEKGHVEYESWLDFDGSLSFPGVFLVNADTSLVVATYPAIASAFRILSEGYWLLSVDGVYAWVQRCAACCELYLLRTLDCFEPCNVFCADRERNKLCSCVITQSVLSELGNGSAGTQQIHSFS